MGGFVKLDVEYGVNSSGKIGSCLSNELLQDHGDLAYIVIGAENPLNR